MELRKVEGILLQESLLGRAEEQTAQKTRELNLKLLTQVPDVVRNLLTNQKLKGKVLDVGRNFLLLQLDTGEEILVRNALSTGLERGEDVILQLVRKNPYVLKVIKSEKLLKNTLNLLSKLGNLKGYPFKEVKTFQGFKNSGIFYERNLLKALIKKDFKEINRDLKYQAFVRGDTNLLDSITLLQLFALEQKNRKIFLPLDEGNKRGGILLKKLKRGFKFLIELEFEKGYLLVEIDSPEDGSFLNIKLESNSAEILDRLGNLEGLKELYPIRRVKKEVKPAEDIKRTFIGELTEGSVLNLKV